MLTVAGKEETAGFVSCGYKTHVVAQKVYRVVPVCVVVLLQLGQDFLIVREFVRAVVKNVIRVSVYIKN